MTDRKDATEGSETPRNKETEKFAYSCDDSKDTKNLTPEQIQECLARIEQEPFSEDEVQAIIRSQFRKD